jgi:hypothetical protein
MTDQTQTNTATSASNSPDRATTYRAYMLRMWREDTNIVGEKPRWRLSLEDPYTGYRTGFATVQALCAYLISQTATPHIDG